jgi:hypothetical protein
LSKAQDILEDYQANREVLMTEIGAPRCQPLMRFWHYRSFETDQACFSYRVLDASGDVLISQANKKTATPQAIEIRFRRISPTDLSQHMDVSPDFLLRPFLPHPGGLVLDGEQYGVETFGMLWTTRLSWCHSFGEWTELSKWVHKSLAAYETMLQDCQLFQSSLNPK